jgi:general secretion pathway protein G
MQAGTRNKGFTLMEMLVVLVIIALLAGIAVPVYFSRVATARLQKAQTDFGTIATALALYKLDNDMLPTSEQGLAALVSRPRQAPVPARFKPGGYLAELPADPWGFEYQYLAPSRDGSREFELFSLGADGRRGGTGDNADVFR